jgi:hypothetical protein
MVWDFEDNRSDIAMVEEVLSMSQERIPVVPVFVVEGILKITHCDSVGSEHIGSDSDESAKTRPAMDCARVAFYQKLALVPADSLASGSTDLKLLNMDMLFPVHMSRFVEPELEDNVFASVTSQVQAEGIQPLNVKGIRCREDNIRIDGHRHHRCVGSALKQIEITHVQAWILFREFGIEMMGHRFSSLPMRYLLFALIHLYKPQATWLRLETKRAQDFVLANCRFHGIEGPFRVSLQTTSKSKRVKK